MVLIRLFKNFRKKIILLLIIFAVGIFFVAYTLIFPKERFVYTFCVSKDERIFLVECSNFKKNTWGLFSTDKKGKRKKLLKELPGPIDLTISPDEQSIGYTIMTIDPNLSGVWRLNLLENKPIKLTSNSFSLDFFLRYSHPKWSPNGKKIAFVKEFLNKKDLSSELTDKQLWMIDLETRKEEMLIPNFIIPQFEWKHTGEGIYFLETRKNHRRKLTLYLYFININNKLKKKVIKEMGIYFFHPSPCDNRIVFLSGKNRKILYLIQQNDKIEELLF